MQDSSNFQILLPALVNRVDLIKNPSTRVGEASLAGRDPPFAE